MSNAEHYLCDGTKCDELKHKPLNLNGFEWKGLVDHAGAPKTVDDLADIIIVFISKGWCKYCCRISPVLNRIQDYDRTRFTFVIQNHSFIEKPFQEDGFIQFMAGKKFLNMNYEPQSEQELADFRLFLRDHSIEFPALFVFDRKSGKVITNDGYNAIKSVFDLKAGIEGLEACPACESEFKHNVLAKWEAIAKQ